jgi:proton glutamate symport protein
MAILRRVTLSQLILLSLVVGIAIGHFFPSVGIEFDILSTIFLHLIKCVVVPLIFSMLVVGIAGHADDMKSVGRLALRSFIYFEIVTTLALVIGLAAVNLVQPGKGVQLAAPVNETTQKLAENSAKVNFKEVIEHTFPTSFFDAAAHNDVLQIVVFALIFAVALSQVKGRSHETMLHVTEALGDVMFKFTGLVMYMAPLGVMGAIASSVGKNGLGILLNLGKLALTLYGALIVFIVVVLIPVMLISRIPVLRFFRTVRQPFLLAFSTATSEAALPDALRLMEQFGVPRRIVSFVLPAGYSFNLDGSTLYLSLASVFVAQAAGVELSIADQAMMALTLMLTSKGVAAVPRASLVILSGTLTKFNLPLAGVALILGIDAFLDMARTSVNLLGNCLASAVMARWEGELRLTAQAPHDNLEQFQHVEEDTAEAASSNSPNPKHQSTIQ